ncbi:hypothetical protein CDL15_Pgr016363 [Punica granatum]|uniref:Uncharacterized protein n=1 Tax=Punica granatum TaxID=22663 RepID=A0A218W6J8_PUNGR|nr:hypothetical protein CDL15_Pgr016363 [Punica granatum]
MKVKLELPSKASVSVYISITNQSAFPQTRCLELLQKIEDEKLKQDHVQLSEENNRSRVQTQKLAEEASYAEELALLLLSSSKLGEGSGKAFNESTVDLSLG